MSDDNLQGNGGVELGKLAVYALVSVVTALAAVGTRLWRLVARLADVEFKTTKLAEQQENNSTLILQQMSEYRDQLKRHQEEDCEGLRAINETMRELSKPVFETAEATSWIKKELLTSAEDRRLIHDRISEHDKRNRDHTSEIKEELNRRMDALEKRLNSRRRT